MEDQQSTAPSTESGEDQLPEVVATGFIASVKTEVATLVTSDIVRNRFIGKVQDVLVSKYAELLDKAYTLLIKHSSELNKLRPKSPGFAADGTTKLPEIYSADEAKKRKELKDKSERIEKAVTNALDQKANAGTWKALEDALGKNG
jgi:hypothetical protein